MSLVRHQLCLFSVVVGLIAGGCVGLPPFGKHLTRHKVPQDFQFSAQGWASYYDVRFQGRKTASGEIYNDEELTAAHPTLPFGTVLLVRRTATGRYAIVRVNDRGPFVGGRIVDLSRSAAAKIGLLSAGIGRVEVFVIPPHHELIAHL
jgi:rare lipoprotein A